MVHTGFYSGDPLNNSWTSESIRLDWCNLYEEYLAGAILVFTIIINYSLEDNEFERTRNAVRKLIRLSPDAAWVKKLKAQCYDTGFILCKTWVHNEVNVARKK